MTGRSWGAAGAVALAVLLGGCVGDDAGEEPGASPSAPSASASPDASREPSPDASPSAPTEEPDETEGESLASVPLGVGCDALVSPQALYEYNPNVGTDPAFDASAWTLAPVAVQLQGTACGYLNQTSGERIAVSAARVAPGSVDELADQVAARGSAFRTAGSTSTLELVAGDRWIVVEAPAFFGEGDLQPLADAARASTGG